MKSLKQQLEERMESHNVMYYDPRDVFEKERYQMPYVYSFITLEEFCELNGLIEEDLTDNQINFFYEHYGRRNGLPMCRYHVDHDHNDWIIENLQSHDYKIVIKRLSKLLGNYLLDISDELSEKHVNARIIRLTLSKKCDIFNDDSEKTFKLNNSKLAKDIVDILKFHNYYITLIYKYDDENIIILESKQTENATEFVKKSNYVYHVTDKRNVVDILRKGLRPKTKKMQDEEPYRYYTDRIYLISDSDNIKYDLSSVISDLNLWHNYVILKIDISKLNITYWWDDASRGNTVYTIESIPPKFIEVIDNIDNI